MLENGWNTNLTNKITRNVSDLNVGRYCSESRSGALWVVEPWRGRVLLELASFVVFLEFSVALLGAKYREQGADWIEATSFEKSLTQMLLISRLDLQRSESEAVRGKRRSSKEVAGRSWIGSGTAPASGGCESVSIWHLLAGEWPNRDKWLWLRSLG